MNQKQLAHMHDGQRLSDDRLVFVLGGVSMPVQVAVDRSSMPVATVQKVITKPRPIIHKHIGPTN